MSSTHSTRSLAERWEQGSVSGETSSAAFVFPDDV